MARPNTLPDRPTRLIVAAKSSSARRRSPAKPRYGVGVGKHDGVLVEFCGEPQCRRFFDSRHQNAALGNPQAIRVEAKTRHSLQARRCQLFKQPFVRRRVLLLVRWHAKRISGADEGRAVDTPALVPALQLRAKLADAKCKRPLRGLDPIVGPPVGRRERRWR